MRPYTIRKYLRSEQTTALPTCTFERTISCRQCIYFESHSPDSKGQCRCSYKGRWYYPDEGCTNGMTIPQPLYDPAPPHDHTNDTDFDPHKNIHQTLYGPPPIHKSNHFSKKKNILLIIMLILIAAVLAVILGFTSFSPLIPCILIAIILLLTLRLSL